MTPKEFYLQSDLDIDTRKEIFVFTEKYHEALSKWIDVSDRIPENNQSVLCYNGHRMVENSWMVATDQDEEWFKRTFTHWRQLPPIPESLQERERRVKG